MNRRGAPPLAVPVAGPVARRPPARLAARLLTSRMRMSAVALLVMCAAASAVSAQPAPLRGLDAYVEAAMRDWQVPGLALAVVRGDSVIYVRGYGVLEDGRPERVDENTMFAIASTTKAMTVAGLGMLVDERKLRWDDPVSQYLPWLQLDDPYITRALSVRDLLTHRSGLSRSDQLWIAAPFDRAEVLRRARHLPQSAGFRAEYGYQNIMYIAAGEVLAAAAAVSWDDFLAERLFRPLGMSRTTTRAAEVEAASNVASSHVKVDGAVRAVPRRNYDNIGGAGAAFSSARDMAQWIRLHLGGGSVGGTRLLAESTLREMHTPQTVMRSDSVAERMFPTTNFRAYGMGWFLQDYDGRKLVHHSGSLNWTRTQVMMVPAEGVGVVVIANLSTSNLQLALAYRIMDALLGLPPRDWSAEYLELTRRSDARSAVQARETEASRASGTTPSLTAEQYAGRYVSDVFGALELEADGGRLVLRYTDDYTADLEHWHHDTFRASWRRTGFGRGFATFRMDARGRVTGLQLEDFGEFRRADPGSLSGAGS